MGNCCGREQAFQGEGRTLGATPAVGATPSATRANLPAGTHVSRGGRTLGDSTQGQAQSETPGAAAARAAERRKAAQGKGNLGKQLDAQKAQTQSATLAQSARENVAARDADAANKSLNWQ
ncbi:uncharacterized protein K489DRAFT_264636 [Dissoconium aciculare CBS 342.82]|uniref:Uncharacterized protein n=1 Tax=Dissoconium aciculare CBS 342.82 TaxID=1314786 RepID=A0A6J3LZ92_9PEZI|nr:uncharacterized protein K489DRAFT_264636 [Dissoconium aciculare CBS 342.82]KAF1821076.1 hypothetical protein K489DRAFT_264636 [Dissoconium aciculare CBS 342.82]